MVIPKPGASENSFLFGNNAVYQVILEGDQLDAAGVFAFDIDAPYVTIRGLQLQDWGNASGGGSILASSNADHFDDRRKLYR